MPLYSAHLPPSRLQRRSTLRLIVALLFTAACSSGTQARESAQDASTTVPGEDGGVLLPDGARPDDGAPAPAPDGGTSRGPTVGGCPMFPADYSYNEDISNVPLDPNSSIYIDKLVARTAADPARDPPIRPPHGNGDEYKNIVPGSQPYVRVDVSGGSQSFDANGAFVFAQGPTAMVPVPNGVRYEGRDGVAGDHHMMVVDQGTCRLFELYSWNPSSPTTGWASLQIWDLTKKEQLPDGKGSSTAAGTALLPGVIWKDEVDAGVIKHALDFAMGHKLIAKYTHVKPASRSAGACDPMSDYPEDFGFPYGGRLRLKASFDAAARGITGNQARIVLRALQIYGWINTDDAGYLYQSDFRFGDGKVWDVPDIGQLGKLQWSDFEVPMMDVVTSKTCR